MSLDLNEIGGTLSKTVQSLSNPDTGEEVPYVTCLDWGLQVTLGNIVGYSEVTVFGRHEESTTAEAPRDLWAGDGDYTGQPTGTTSELVTIKSDNSSDSSLLPGAHSVRIFGLKTSTSGVYESEDILTNGTTAVDSVNTWWRINKVVVLTAGSSGSNVGTITIAHKTTTTNIFASVPPGINHSMIGAYTIPQGCTGVIKNLRIALTRSNGSAGSAQVTLRVREPDGVYQAVRNFEVGSNSAASFSDWGGLVVAPGSDLKFRTESLSDSDSFVEAEVEIVVVDNNLISS